MLKAYSISNDATLSVGRESTWTILPVFRGDRKVIEALILQRN